MKQNQRGLVVLHPDMTNYFPSQDFLQWSQLRIEQQWTGLAPGPLQGRRKRNDLIETSYVIQTP